MTITKSYTLNGCIKNEMNDWIAWVKNSKMIEHILGINFNHCSIASVKGTQIKSLKGLEDKIVKLYTRGDSIESISLLKIPEHCASMIFDFEVSFTINEFGAYETLILNSKYYELDISPKNEEAIIQIMRENVIAPEGEIYEMDIKECPEFYAGKANDKEFYKSLNVIKKF